MDIQKLLEEAIHVVNMFDQANTNSAVQRLGSRGEILKQAIDDLRAVLNVDEKRTCLTQEEAR